MARCHADADAEAQARVSPERLLSAVSLRWGMAWEKEGLCIPVRTNPPYQRQLRSRAGACPV